jgi:hypothetical protein
LLSHSISSPLWLHLSINFHSPLCKQSHEPKNTEKQSEILFARQALNIRRRPAKFKGKRIMKLCRGTKGERKKSVKMHEKLFIIAQNWYASAGNGNHTKPKDLLK